jgi:branched-chain amino acid transport system permease protein
MDYLLAQVLNGLVYGMLLFLMASGLSLIFGLMNVVSLVHGSFFMLGAYLGLTVFQLTQSFWLALLLGPIPVVLIGLAVEYGFMRRLYRRSHLDQVLLTFGFSFVFLDVVRTLWGSNIRSLAAPAALQLVVPIAGGMFSLYRLFLIAIGLLVAGGLWLVLDRSRLGAMVRAGVDDSAMAAGLGANIPALFSGVFGLGVALAAVGGILAAPVLGLYPGMDADMLIPAFIVIVIGGMGSLRGAFAGSLIIGLADTFGKAYVPGLALFLVYLVMAAVLLVRPQGIFGVLKGPAAAASSAPPPAAALTLRGGLVGLAVIAGLVIMPLLAPEYATTLLTEIFIFGLLAMSLDLMLGYTGMPSLGHAAFFALGAYAVVILGSVYNVNAWEASLAGVGLAAVAAVVMGALCVRASGVTLLMLTLALSQLIYSAALKWRGLTGGSDGIGMPDKPPLFGWDLTDATTMYYTMLVFLLLGYALLRRLVASPVGHVFVGIRENEQRMRAIGYEVDLYKLAAFIIAAGIAGFAGALYAIFNGFVSPDTAYWSASGDVLIMVVLGGAGTLIGPVIGAGFFLLMKNLVSSYSDHWMLIIGVLFVGSVLFFPLGIWGSLRTLRLPERTRLLTRRPV